MTTILQTCLHVCENITTKLRTCLHYCENFATRLQTFLYICENITTKLQTCLQVLACKFIHNWLVSQLCDPHVGLNKHSLFRDICKCNTPNLQTFACFGL